MKKVYVALLTFLIALSVIFIYRSLSNPIKIALIGNFEDERYNFDTNSIIAGRIAEKYINENRGIRGKSTELIIRNDNLMEPDKTIEFLKKNNIEAIISTNNSEELMRVKRYLDENKIVCMSVGSTTSNLSGKSDYIYRLVPDDEKELKAIANYLTSQGIGKDVVLVYNQINLEYINSVKRGLESFGIDIISEEGWAGNSLNYTPSDYSRIKDKPVLILAPARDTGIIVQKLKPLTSNLYALSWSADNNLLVYGGRAVEGLKFTSPVDFNSTEGHYRILSERLKEYSKNNGLIPNGVYQAYILIRNAYELKSEKHLTLKQALDSEAVYDGLDKYTRLDAYGDSTMEEYIFAVKDGRFVKIGGRSYERDKN
jgi:ABC-type branched-subunit amino acid transport system substrate-binding protein